jgi:hypothetical protein
MVRRRLMTVGFEQFHGFSGIARANPERSLCYFQFIQHDEQRHSHGRVQQT